VKIIITNAIIMLIIVLIIDVDFVLSLQ